MSQIIHSTATYYKELDALRKLDEACGSMQDRTDHIIKLLNLSKEKTFWLLDQMYKLDHIRKCEECRKNTSVASLMDEILTHLKDDLAAPAPTSNHSVH